MEQSHVVGITKDWDQEEEAHQDNCPLASISHSLALTLSIHVVSSLYISAVGLVFLFSENQ